MGLKLSSRVVNVCALGLRSPFSSMARLGTRDGRIPEQGDTLGKCHSQCKLKCLLAKPPPPHLSTASHTETPHYRKVTVSKLFCTLTFRRNLSSVFVGFLAVVSVGEAGQEKC